MIDCPAVHPTRGEPCARGAGHAQRGMPRHASETPRPGETYRCTDVWPWKDAEDAGP